MGNGPIILPQLHTELMKLICILEGTDVGLLKLYVVEKTTSL